MTITDAIAFAAQRHKRQTDKAGAPYIWHPLRVAMRLDCGDAQLAAVLHDVLEDTKTTEQELRRRGVPLRVLEALRLLTKRPDDGSRYLQFIRRLKVNAIARVVKEADILDNLDPGRLALLAPEERRRLKAKYRPALVELRKR